MECAAKSTHTTIYIYICIEMGDEEVGGRCLANNFSYSAPENGGGLEGDFPNR